MVDEDVFGVDVSVEEHRGAGAEQVSTADEDGDDLVGFTFGETGGEELGSFGVSIANEGRPADRGVGPDPVLIGPPHPCHRNAVDDVEHPAEMAHRSSTLIGGQARTEVGQRSPRGLRYDHGLAFSVCGEDRRGRQDRWDRHASLAGHGHRSNLGGDVGGPRGPDAHVHAGVVRGLDSVHLVVVAPGESLNPVDRLAGRVVDQPPHLIRFDAWPRMKLLEKSGHDAAL